MTQHTYHLMNPEHCADPNCPHENRGMTHFYNQQKPDPLWTRVLLVVLLVVGGVSWVYFQNPGLFQ